MTRPHYLRFVRTLALLSAAVAPGCYLAHERPGDAPDTGPVADAGPFTCASCVCGGAGNECAAIGHSECCLRAGPLPPPDLPTA